MQKLKRGRIKTLAVFLFSFSYFSSLDTTSMNEVLKLLDILGVKTQELSYEKKWAIDTLYRLSIVEKLLDEPLKIPDYCDRSINFIELNQESCLNLSLFLAKETDVSISDREVQKLKKEFWATFARLKGFKQDSKLDSSLTFLKTGFLLGNKYLKSALRNLTEKDKDILFAEIPFLFSDDDEPADDFLRGILLKEVGISYDTLIDITIETLLVILRKIKRETLFYANWCYLYGIDNALFCLKKVKEEDLGKMPLLAYTPAGVKGTVFYYEEGEFGKIVIGGFDNNIYEGDFSLIIDLGGEDIYKGRVAFGIGLEKEKNMGAVFDLKGNDFYDASGQIFNLGGGLLGSGFLFDLAGNDYYKASHYSLGCGIAGMGILCDFGGDDVYDGGIGSQGVGFWGWGMVLDFLGNDIYRCYTYGQGFASTFGYGLLADFSGEDLYYAGGRYFHAPLLPDEHRALAQGFAIGFRPEASGGIGLLYDKKGNDFYNAGVFAQGSSYWYALGMLFDGNGNDHYLSPEYAQGAGIHLAVGVLIDQAGNDNYFSRLGPAQGEGHDLSCGILIDCDGNDNYYASGGQGIGLTNSFGLFIDKNGDDNYYTREPGFGQGGANIARGFGGVGIFLDLKGSDSYAQGNLAENSSIWTQGNYGIGLDVRAPKEERKREEDTIIKEDFTKMEIKELFKYASKWEVGSAKRIVREARKELIKRKEEALSYILKEKFGTKSGLEFRAIEEFSESLPDLIKPHLFSNLRSDNIFRRANAIYLLGKIKAKDAIDSLLLALKNPKNRPRWVLYALGEIGDSSAIPAIIEFINHKDEPTRIYACVALGKIKNKKALPYLISKLQDKLFTVRQSAEGALSEIGHQAVEALLETLEKAKRKEEKRVVLSILRILTRIIPKLDTLENRAERIKVKTTLIPFLAEKDASLRAQTVDCLAQFKEDYIKNIFKERIHLESDDLVLKKLKEYIK